MKITTLFQKTLIGQLVLFGVVAFTTSVASGWTLYQYLSEEYLSKGQAIAKSIADSSESLIGISPVETIQATIDQFAEIQGISYVFVVDANKEIVAHTFVPQIPEQLGYLANFATATETIQFKNFKINHIGKVTDISAPILAGAAGYVHVGMDRGLIETKIFTSIASQLAIIFLLFILSALATYVMVKRISQPLSELTEYSQQLAAKNFEAMLTIQTRDEVGLLAKTMKSMATEIQGFVSRLEVEVKNATAELEKTLAALKIEQEKSERLLFNILPEPIAEQLKEGQSNIADGFAEVTILFADLVGFTQLSKRVTPTQLVNWLNELFSNFDELCDRYRLEKIKTIGDAYMVVGGIPFPHSDHAQAIAEMALSMQQEILKFNQKHQTELDLRIGINTGPVVAGVIGTKKFIYDLWGDAVNTASRMESQGIAGSIQVTDETYKCLYGKYEFQYRGVIDIKGKGEMDTYILLGRLHSRLDQWEGLLS
jgi:class 3 adenylate cyclase/HAMP domain-containing protein